MLAMFSIKPMPQQALQQRPGRQALRRGARKQLMETVEVAGAHRQPPDMNGMASLRGLNNYSEQRQVSGNYHHCTAGIERRCSCGSKEPNSIPWIRLQEWKENCRGIPVQAHTLYWDYTLFQLPPLQNPTLRCHSCHHK